MASRPPTRRALIIWLRALPNMAILRLVELDARQPVTLAMAACFWIAMKCDGHRRSITKASRLASVTGCSAKALPAAEVYIMDLIDWAPYKGLTDAPPEVPSSPQGPQAAQAAPHQAGLGTGGCPCVAEAGAAEPARKRQRTECAARAA